MILLFYTIPDCCLSTWTSKARCIYYFPYLLTFSGFIPHEDLSLNPVKSTASFDKEFNSSAVQQHGEHPFGACFEPGSLMFPHSCDTKHKINNKSLNLSMPHAFVNLCYNIF